jgi:ankyrin repeat protein
MKFFSIGLMTLFLWLSSAAWAVNRDAEGLTPLHRAAGIGNLKQVKALTAKGADVLALDSHMGVSVLHKAVYSGNPEVVDFLLKRGALIDLQSPSNGNTPLHDAIYFRKGDDLRVIRVLLAHNPTIAIKNKAGLTPLDSAIVLKDAVTQHLLEDYLHSKYTAAGQKLMALVRDNRAAEVQTFLEKTKVNLEETDEQGFTPLLWASRQGYTSIVKMLLDKGANPNHEDQWMRATAGHKAAFWGHADVMSLLITHGLNVDARGGYNGYTALHDAISQNHADVAKVLLDHHARKDIRGHDGKTVLDIAKASGHPELLQLLSA